MAGLPDNSLDTEITGAYHRSSENPVCYRKRPGDPINGKVIAYDSLEVTS